jgi:hypothetical protein
MVFPDVVQLLASNPRDSHDPQAPPIPSTIHDSTIDSLDSDDDPPLIRPILTDNIDPGFRAPAG